MNENLNTQSGTHPARPRSPLDSRPGPSINVDMPRPSAAPPWARAGSPPHPRRSSSARDGLRVVDALEAGLDLNGLAQGGVHLSHPGAEARALDAKVVRARRHGQ